MEHNIESLHEYLTERGIHVASVEKDNVITKHNIEEREVQIKGVLPNEFPLVLPKFYLENREEYELLAHVSPAQSPFICHTNEEGVSIDYTNPNLVYHQALLSSLGVIKSNLQDDNYKKEEIQREFLGFWQNYVSPTRVLFSMLEVSEKSIRSVSISNDTRPFLLKHEKRIVQFATDKQNIKINNSFYLYEKSIKERKHRTKGVVIHFDQSLMPLESSELGILKKWWSEQLDNSTEEFQEQLLSYARNNKSRNITIICTTRTKNGYSWFGFRCYNRQRIILPLSSNHIKNWFFEPLNIVPISSDSLISRGGGNDMLNLKKVCIVGCGSLGGTIADLLASSGVGNLSLIDPENYTIENIYRHVLDSRYLYQGKSLSLKKKIEAKYPFVKVEANTKANRLLDVEGIDYWSSFDAIVIAIGLPSQERYFNQFLKDNGITIPIIYTWIEPYSVGGHSVVSFSNTKGCLACLYVDKEKGMPSLYPSINFIEQGQNLHESVGSCATDFIAFSVIDVNQTASMASRLIIRSLTGDIKEGVSVSWKGFDPDHRLIEKGIKLTHRYYRFENMLKEIPIKSDSCHICNA